jgi:C4-dicarboxylate-specific signal transduction histidine kinase
MEKESARTQAHYLRLLDGYSELGAIGQAAIRLSEWTQPLYSQVLGQRQKIRRLIHRSEKPALIGHFDQLEDSLECLFARLALLAPFGRTDGRKGRLIDIAAELRAFHSMISPFIETNGVRMFAEVPRNSVLRVHMNPESFWRVLLILTLNSVDWLHDIKSAQVRVKVRAKGDWCELIFSDNGPGILPQLAEKVFEPLFSTKEGGRGMGLTIARDILARHRGRIEVSTGRRRGAHLVINLRRKGVR